MLVDHTNPFADLHKVRYLNQRRHLNQRLLLEACHNHVTNYVLRFGIVLFECRFFRYPFYYLVQLIRLGMDSFKCLSSAVFCSYVRFWGVLRDQRIC